MHQYIVEVGFNIYNNTSTFLNFLIIEQIKVEINVLEALRLLWQTRLYPLGTWEHTATLPATLVTVLCTFQWYLCNASNAVHNSLIITN